MTKKKSVRKTKKWYSDQINTALSLEGEMKIDWSKLERDDLIKFQIIIETWKKKGSVGVSDTVDDGGSFLAGFTVNDAIDFVANNISENELKDLEKRHPFIAKLAGRFMDKRGK